MRKPLPTLVMTIPDLGFDDGYVHCLTHEAGNNHKDFPTGTKIRVAKITSNPSWPRGRYIYTLQLDDGKMMEITGTESEELYLCSNPSECENKRVEII